LFLVLLWDFSSVVLSGLGFGARFSVFWLLRSLCGLFLWIQGKSSLFLRDLSGSPFFHRSKAGASLLCGIELLGVLSSAVSMCKSCRFRGVSLCE